MIYSGIPSPYSIQQRLSRDCISWLRLLSINNASRNMYVYTRMSVLYKYMHSQQFANYTRVKLLQYVKQT